MIEDNSFCITGRKGRAALREGAFFSLYPRSAAQILFLLLLVAAAIPANGREKDVLQYGEGLIVNIPLPEPEVAQVVEDVVQNTIIRGTKEYNKDEYIAAAVAAISTPVFPAWKEGGKVFYKVRKQALNPWNFKDSADVGTLAVRYVIQPQGDKNTVLRIDALFVEDFRHTVHKSSGSVESAEYKDIQDRLQSVELIKQETAEALRIKQERSAKESFGLGGTGENASEGGISTSRDQELLSTPPPMGASAESGSRESLNANAQPVSPQPSTGMPPQSSAYDPAGETLEQHVAELRRQVERLVMKPGAPLKSAPFHTASTLKSLQPGVEVLILIATPYWYGVETREGDHGWMRRDQLEQMP